MWNNRLNLFLLCLCHFLCLCHCLCLCLCHCLCLHCLYFKLEHVPGWIYIGPEQLVSAPLGARPVLFSQSGTEKMKNHTLCYFALLYYTIHPSLFGVKTSMCPFWNELHTQVKLKGVELTIWSVSPGNGIMGFGLSLSKAHTLLICSLARGRRRIEGLPVGTGERQARPFNAFHLASLCLLRGGGVMFQTHKTKRWNTLMHLVLLGRLGFLQFFWNSWSW